MSQVQYITDEYGSQIGVILDIKDYRNLISQGAADPELLIGLSRDELYALADSHLSLAEQEKLDSLLALNNADELSDAEATELEQLLSQIDQLNILKTRAQYTLHHLNISHE